MQKRSLAPMAQSGEKARLQAHPDCATPLSEVTGAGQDRAPAGDSLAEQELGEAGFTLGPKDCRQLLETVGFAP